MGKKKKKICHTKPFRQQIIVLRKQHIWNKEWSCVSTNKQDMWTLSSLSSPCKNPLITMVISVFSVSYINYLLLYVNLLEVAQIPWHDLRVSKCHQLRSATEIVTFWGRHIFTPTQHDNNDIIVMLCIIRPYISNTHISQRSCYKIVIETWTIIVNWMIV